jgi:hypothetical protein
MKSEENSQEEELRRLVKKATYCGLSVGILKSEPVVTDLCYFSYMANRKSSPLTDEGIRQACSPYLMCALEKYEAVKRKESGRKNKKAEATLKWIKETLSQ